MALCLLAHVTAAVCAATKGGTIIITGIGKGGHGSGCKESCKDVCEDVCKPVDVEVCKDVEVPYEVSLYCMHASIMVCEWSSMRHLPDSYDENKQGSAGPSDSLPSDVT